MTTVDASETGRSRCEGSRETDRAAAEDDARDAGRAAPRCGALMSGGRWE